MAAQLPVAELEAGAIGSRRGERRKYRPDPKTTISIGASAEQVSGRDVAPPEVTLVVEALTRLGDQCPAR